MKTSLKRILWWGIGLLIFGALTYVVSTSLSIQASMISDPTGHTVYYWFLSPALLILQNAAYPLGAALIGASVVMRYIAQAPRLHQQSATNQLDL